MSVSLHTIAHPPSVPASRTPVNWLEPTHDTDRSNLMRQTWQRTMRDGNQTEKDVLNTSRAESTNTDLNDPNKHSAPSFSPPRRKLSFGSSGRGSRSPLTPDLNVSPKPARKRTASHIDQEDRETEGANDSTSESRRDSDESALHVCICQPDPKIPRPRNAFILYRQHRQAAVVSANPGLANPDISKIIGEQWQNESIDVKNQWKALAEEEKLRHQQQHPTYRYQPKRNGRRNSVSLDGPSSAGSRSSCAKCGGQTTLAPGQSLTDRTASTTSTASGPTTPGSVITPVTRTLPTLRELSLESPPPHQTGRPRQENMSMNSRFTEERDIIGPLSPENKRRRVADVPLLSRIMPPRYTGPSHLGNVATGPATPYPYTQPSSHPYPMALSRERHESLPGIRGVMTSPAPMPPPPRPGMGYQQHRIAYRQPAQDRSLTLPPLQTSRVEAASGPSGERTSGGDASEEIMSMDFRYKIKVLNQVAPPAPVSRGTPRGPLIAIEGDDPECVNKVGSWLHEELSKGSDRNVTLLDSPAVSADGSKEKIMATYHRLIAEWLEKSHEISDCLAMRVTSPTDSVMIDAGSVSTTRGHTTGPDDNTGNSNPRNTGSPVSRTSEKTADQAHGSRAEQDMTSNNSELSRRSISTTGGEITKPIGLVANYSLYASDFYACHIPITAPDPYSPSDHWQWMATAWRGIVSPDLTIYVRDSRNNNGKQPAVEFSEQGSICVIKRTKANDDTEIEPSTLRRLAFEIDEWVRAFGGRISL